MSYFYTFVFSKYMFYLLEVLSYKRPSEYIASYICFDKAWLFGYVLIVHGVFIAFRERVVPFSGQVMEACCGNDYIHAVVELR